MTADPGESPDNLPRLAVLLSGTGRTLEYLLDDTRSGRIPARIALVVASRECRGADIGRAAGIETLIIPRRIPRDELDALTRDRDIEWVVLAGYLRLIEVPTRLAGRVVNIHPALLPDFGGPGMHGHHVHQAVLDAGRPETGCTVHLCDDTYDTGPIVLQKRCPVLPGDTADTLAARVFDLERNAYPEALVQLLAGSENSPTPPGQGDRPGAIPRQRGDGPHR